MITDISLANSIIATAFLMLILFLDTDWKNLR
jgi:hypothetical protein